MARIHTAIAAVATALLLTVAVVTVTEKSRTDTDTVVPKHHLPHIQPKIDFDADAGHAAAERKPNFALDRMPAVAKVDIVDADVNVAPPAADAPENANGARRMANTESQTQPLGPGGSPSRIFGDPHFVGLLGQKFRLEGKPNKVYNIISTPKFQLNALFRKNGDQVVMAELGFQAENDAVFISRHARLRVNDVPVGHDATTAFAPNQHGLLHRDLDGTMGGPTLETDDIRINVAPRGYEVDIKNIGLKVPADNSFHGLLGQTWQNAWGKNDELSPEEAWKHLEGKMDDYLVSDGLFGTNFKFNKFTNFAKHVTPDVSELIHPQEDAPVKHEAK